MSEAANLNPSEAIPPNSQPVAPPAADAVLTGTKTEVEIKLETELAEEKKNHGKTADEKKQREIRINELEDELRRLREAQSIRSPEKRIRFKTLLHDED